MTQVLPASPNDHRSLLPRGVMFSPELCSAFGICGGLLVQQIHYWCMDRKNLVDGYYWVWNSTKEWANQLQVFDERTIKAHLKMLRDLSIVVTANHNRIGYDRTLWYRVNYPALTQALVTKFPNMVFQIHDPLGKIFTNLCEPVSQPIPETNSETTAESILVEASPLPTGETPPKPPRKTIKLVIPLTSGDTPEPLKDPPMPKIVGSAKDILAAHQLRKNPTKALNTSGSLQSIWRREVPHAFPGTFIPEFTMVERGQFSSIAKALESDADRVLTGVLQSWVGYTKHVASAVGLHKTPDAPHVGFVLKYVGQAKGYVVTSTPQPVKSFKPKKEPVQLTAPKPSPEKDVASIDDVMAWKPK